MSDKIPAWSFSSLNDFYNCPRAYQLKRVTRECKQEETEAMRHGTETHKHLELRVVDKTPLPKHLQGWESMMKQFEDSGMQMQAETQIALDRNLKPTGWFAKDTWLRVIVDLTMRKPGVSVLWDYKTGKRKHDSDQLMLFAGVEMALMPDVGEVRTGYIWLKDRALDAETFTRGDIPRIWGHFLPKVEKLERAFKEDDWPTRPSGLCGWCPASRAQCKYSKR